jgi:hypothetical protein
MDLARERRKPTLVQINQTRLLMGGGGIRVIKALARGAIGEALLRLVFPYGKKAGYSFSAKGITGGEFLRMLNLAGAGVTAIELTEKLGYGTPIDIDEARRHLPPPAKETDTGGRLPSVEEATEAWLNYTTPSAAYIYIQSGSPDAVRNLAAAKRARNELYAAVQREYPQTWQQVIRQMDIRYAKLKPIYQLSTSAAPATTKAGTLKRKKKK